MLAIFRKNVASNPIAMKNVAQGLFTHSFLIVLKLEFHYRRVCAEVFTMVSGCRLAACRTVVASPWRPGASQASPPRASLVLIYIPALHA